MYPNLTEAEKMHLKQRKEITNWNVMENLPL